MGSQQFTTYGRGMSAKEAYDRAVEAANDEYGHQEGYSGEINSSAGFRDITEEYKRSKKHLRVFMDEQFDRLTKFDGARAICIDCPVENTNKTKSQVQHVVEKGTKKWVLLYCVYEGWSDRFIASFDKKGDAIKRAREHCEKHKADIIIKMERKLEKGNPITAKISYKKSTKEKQGKWIFFGWASC